MKSVGIVGHGGVVVLKRADEQQERSAKAKKARRTEIGPRAKGVKRRPFKRLGRPTVHGPWTISSGPPRRSSARRTIASETDGWAERSRGGWSSQQRLSKECERSKGHASTPPTPPPPLRLTRFRARRGTIVCVGRPSLVQHQQTPEAAQNEVLRFHIPPFFALTLDLDASHFTHMS